MSADAKSYAQALFEAGQPLKLLPELEAVSEVVSANRRYKQILVDAGTRDRKAAASIVSRLLPKASPITRNLLLLLATEREVDDLPRIATEFRALAKERLGLVDVLIESAYPLSKAEQARLLKALPLRGRQPLVTVRTDQSLLGGVRISVEGTVYDQSVAGALEEITEQVTA